jgi:WD40 repeat protein
MPYFLLGLDITRDGDFFISCSIFTCTYIYLHLYMHMDVYLSVCIVNIFYYVSGLDITRDGDFFISCSNDKLIKLWTYDEGEIYTDIYKHIHDCIYIEKLTYLFQRYFASV